MTARSVMHRRWRYVGVTPEGDETLGAAMMRERGLADAFSPNDRERVIKQKQDRFLAKHTKAFAELKDVEDASQRIADAIMGGEKIYFSSDYDCDGNCSAAMMRRFLRDAGVRDIDADDPQMKVHIPNRFDEGYGYNEKAAEEAKNWGAGLVITLDNGTKAHAPIAETNNHGIDVVVLDHHPNSKGEALPQGGGPDAAKTWVVNPCRADVAPDNPYRPLAAVGVTFFTIMRAHELLKERGYYAQKQTAQVKPESYLGLATLATVADVVDISGPVNRRLIQFGLCSINREDDAHINMMVRDIGKSERLQSEDIAFSIAPRINASGRLKDSIAWKLLSDTSADDLQAMLKVLRQSKDNRERQNIEVELTNKARKQVHGMMQGGDPATLPPVLLVGGEDWHEGVIGIVAGRMKEEFGRPVVAYSIDEHGAAKASGRNLKVEGYQTDLGQAFRDLAEDGVLAKAGGHPMAAGCSFHADKLEAFCDTLNAHMQQQGIQDAINHFALEVDAVLPIEHDFNDFLSDIEQLQPFGEGNPRPRVVIPKVKVMDGYKTAGARNRHAMNLTLLDAGAGNAHIHANAFGSGGTPLRQAMNDPRAKCVLGTLNEDFKGEPVMFIEDAHKPRIKDRISAMLGEIFGDAHKERFKALDGKGATRTL